MGPAPGLLLFSLVSGRVDDGSWICVPMVGPVFVGPILCPDGGPIVVLTLRDRVASSLCVVVARDQSTESGRYGKIPLMRITLSTWARQQGVPYSTANRWFHQGLLPEGVKPVELPSGALMVEVDPLAGLDIHEIARRLEAAGYRFASKPDDPS